MNGNDRYYDNLAIIDTKFDGKTYGSNHVALNESGDTGQSVDLMTSAQVGVQLITDPNFDDETKWDIDADWDLSSGKAVKVASSTWSYLKQKTDAPKVEIGKMYKCIIYVESVTPDGTTNTLKMNIGAIESYPILEAGRHLYYFMAYEDNQVNILKAYRNTVCVVTEFSIQEVTSTDTYMLKYDVTTEKHVKIKYEPELTTQPLDISKFILYGSNTITETVDTFTINCIDNTSGGYFSGLSMIDVPYVEGRQLEISFQTDANYYPSNLFVFGETGNYNFQYRPLNSTPFRIRTLSASTIFKFIMTLGESYTFSKTVSVKEVLLPNEEIFTETQSFSNSTHLNVEVTDDDIAYLNSNPEAIARLHFGESVPELSFNDSNIEHFYPGSDRQNGSTIADLKST